MAVKKAFHLKRFYMPPGMTFGNNRDWETGQPADLRILTSGLTDCCRSTAPMRRLNRAVANTPVPSTQRTSSMTAITAHTWTGRQPHSSCANGCDHWRAGSSALGHKLSAAECVSIWASTKVRFCSKMIVSPVLWRLEKQPPSECCQRHM